MPTRRRPSKAGPELTSRQESNTASVTQHRTAAHHTASAAVAAPPSHPPPPRSRQSSPLATTAAGRLHPSDEVPSQRNAADSSKSSRAKRRRKVIGASAQETPPFADEKQHDAGSGSHAAPSRPPATLVKNNPITFATGKTRSASLHGKSNNSTNTTTTMTHLDSNTDDPRDAEGSDTSLTATTPTSTSTSAPEVRPSGTVAAAAAASTAAAAAGTVATAAADSVEIPRAPAAMRRSKSTIISSSRPVKKATGTFNTAASTIATNTKAAAVQTAPPAGPKRREVAQRQRSPSIQRSKTTSTSASSVYSDGTRLSRSVSFEEAKTRTGKTTTTTEQKSAEQEKEGELRASPSATTFTNNHDGRTGAVDSLVHTEDDTASALGAKGLLPILAQQHLASANIIAQLRALGSAYPPAPLGFSYNPYDHVAPYMHDPSSNLATNIYVNGLPSHTSDDDLLRLGSCFGPVKSHKAIINMDTGLCKGYGFIMYDRPEDAELALTQLPQHGLTTSWAKESFSTKLRRMADNSSTNVYLSNLPQDFNATQLEQLFAPHHVVSLRILLDNEGKSRGVGFVRLRDRDTAQECIDRLHGKILPGRSSSIQVRFADSEGQKRLKQTAKNAGPDVGYGTTIDSIFGASSLQQQQQQQQQQQASSSQQQQQQQLLIQLQSAGYSPSAWTGFATPQSTFYSPQFGTPALAGSAQGLSSLASPSLRSFSGSPHFQTFYDPLNPPVSNQLNYQGTPQLYYNSPLSSLASSPLSSFVPAGLSPEVPRFSDGRGSTGPGSAASRSPAAGPAAVLQATSTSNKRNSTTPTFLPPELQQQHAKQLLEQQLLHGQPIDQGQFEAFMRATPFESGYVMGNNNSIAGNGGGGGGRGGGCAEAGAGGSGAASGSSAAMDYVQQMSMVMAGLDANSAADWQASTAQQLQQLELIRQLYGNGGIGQGGSAVGLATEQARQPQPRSGQAGPALGLQVDASIQATSSLAVQPNQPSPLRFRVGQSSIDDNLRTRSPVPKTNSSTPGAGGSQMQGSPRASPNCVTGESPDKSAEQYVNGDQDDDQQQDNSQSQAGDSSFVSATATVTTDGGGEDDSREMTTATTSSGEASVSFALSPSTSLKAIPLPLKQGAHLIGQHGEHANIKQVNSIPASIEDV